MLKAKKVQAEREEEEAFRQRMMAKFAEDDRIEQMNAQRRRMKQLGALYGLVKVCVLHTHLLYLWVKVTKMVIVQMARLQTTLKHETSYQIAAERFLVCY